MGDTYWPWGEDSGRGVEDVVDDVEANVRLLEAKVAENLDSVEQLRQERSMLAADHKELQRRYTKASEVSTLTLAPWHPS